MGVLRVIRPHIPWYKPGVDPVADKPTDQTHGVPRGVAVITLAKAYFLLTGFAQPLVLTRLLHTEGYGLYGVVLNTVSILNNVVVAGSIQAMSRAVTEDGSRALRRGIVLHAILGLTLASALVALAVPLGVGALHDPRVPPLLRVGAIVVGDYTVYAALVGALNGQRRFVSQAGLDITFATLRTALVLGLSATHFGVTGAVVGFAIASAVILAVALVVLLPVLRETSVGKASQSTRIDRGVREFVLRYASFFAPVLVYQLALNLVLQADLLVMKSVLSGRLAPAALDELNGIYKAVQNFAFLPYQLLLSVTFVVFPVVSLTTQTGDKETTRRFVHRALRLSALALGAMLAVLTGLSRGVLLLAFKPEVGVGAAALRVLSVAQGAFALAVIAATLLLAAGRAAAATGLMVAMLLATLAGDYAGLSIVPPGVDSLTATAVGTALGCTLGMLAIGMYTRRVFGSFLSLSTALRVGVSTAAAAWVASRLPLHGKLGTLVAAPVTVGMYFLALVLTRELTRGDLSALRPSQRGAMPTG